MSKEPLKHQAYQYIKNNIINCVYAPDSIINEELIRDELGASRTPIRDALSRLEQEGLVKILPKKGILITDISIKELNMLYETRNLLEPYALKHYGSRVPQEIYLDFHRKYSAYLENPNQPYSFSELDDDFHKLLINKTENDYFINLYSTIESQILRTRVMSGRTSSSRRLQTIQEHSAIIKAALKNDWDGAALAMSAHLEQSKNVLFDYLLSREQ